MAQHASVNEPSCYDLRLSSPQRLVLCGPACTRRQHEAYRAYCSDDEAQRASFGFDRRFSRAKRVTIAILIAVYVLVLTEQFALDTMSNYVSDGSNLQNADFIWMDVFSQSLAILPVFAAGGLCDYFSRHVKLIFVCSSLLAGIGMLIFSVLPSVQPAAHIDEKTISTGAWPYFVAWTIAEIGVAPVWPAVIKFITRWTSVEEQGYMAGILSQGYLFGAALMRAFLGLMIAVGLSWRHCFMVASGSLITVAIAAALFVTSSPSEIARPEPCQVETGFSEEQEAEERVKHFHFSSFVREQVFPLINNLPFFIIALNYLCVASIRYAIGGWFEDYAVNVLGLEPVWAAFAVVLFEGVGGFSAIVTNNTELKLSRVAQAIVLLFFEGLMCISLMAFAVTNSVLSLESLHRHAALICVVFLPLLGFSVLGPFTLPPGFLALRLGKQNASTLSGIFDGFAMCGCIASSVLAGWSYGISGEDNLREGWQIYSSAQLVLGIIAFCLTALYLVYEMTTTVAKGTDDGGVFTIFAVETEKEKKIEEASEERIDVNSDEKLEESRPLLPQTTEPSFG